MADAGRKRAIATAAATATGPAIDAAAAAMACAVIRAEQRASSVAMAHRPGPGYVLAIEKAWQ
jgi:hypothetical protein